MRTAPLGGESRESEVQMQRHLDLARAANGVLGDTQAGWRIVERISSHGYVVESSVLVHVVLGNVEARCIRQVVHVEGVVQSKGFSNHQVLHQRGIGSPLP